MLEVTWRSFFFFAPTLFQNELMGVEAEAMSIEKGLQRRALRQSAVDMSTDANRLSGSAAEKLRHGNKSYADVEDALKTEGDLLQAMKEKNIKAEQALARKLQLQDQVSSALARPCPF